MGRLGYIDIARGIGILLVVYAHVIDIGKFDISKINVIIYSFHMPLFFLLSGVCCNRSSNIISYEMYVWKRCKRLIIPYVVWSCIYIVFLLQQQDHVEVWGVERLFAIITMRGIAPLWFLPTLFFSDIIVGFLIYKNRKTSLIKALIMFAIVSCICVFIFQKYDILNVSMLYSYPFTFIFRQVLCTSFYMIGVFLGRWFSKLNIYSLSLTKLLVISTSTSIALIAIQFYTKNSINIHLFEVSNPFILYITSLLGFFAVIFAALIFEKTIFNKLLRWFGTNSLMTMVLHYPPIPFMSIIFVHVFVKKSLFFSIINTFILLMLIGIIITVLGYVKKVITYNEW